MKWVPLVLMGLVVFWAVFGKSRKYGRILSDKHLAELARQAYALSRADAPRLAVPGLEDKGSGCVTSAGITFVYVREPVEGGTDHQFSLEYRDGVLAQGAGMILAALIVGALGMEPGLVRVAVTNARMILVALTMTPDEERRFEARPAPVLDDMKARLGDAMRQRDLWLAEVGRRPGAAVA
jgi:hypothetical protein